MIRMDYITWLEYNDWQELREGDLVRYHGSMLGAHGLWIVKNRIDETRYQVRAVGNPHVSLNVDRADVTREGNPVG